LELKFNVGNHRLEPIFVGFEPTAMSYELPPRGWFSVSAQEPHDGREIGRFVVVVTPAVLSGHGRTAGVTTLSMPPR